MSQEGNLYYAQKCICLYQLITIDDSDNLLGRNIIFEMQR